MHGHTAVPQRLHETVVLLLGSLRPHHVVEEQPADVLRGQPGQFKTGPMHDDLAEPAYFRMHAESHYRLLCHYAIRGCRHLGAAEPSNETHEERM